MATYLTSAPLVLWVLMSDDDDPMHRDSDGNFYTYSQLRSQFEDDMHELGRDTDAADFLRSLDQ